MPVQLVITRTDEGAVSVNGPIGDKLLCYALIESARDAIYDFHKKMANEQRIVPATLIPPTLPQS